MSNMSVPGFGRDLPGRGVPRFLEAPDTQISRVSHRGGPRAFSERPALLEHTDEPMDIAITDRGYFFIRPPGGAGPPCRGAAT